MPAPQPGTKLLAANGPGFAMLVDLKVGVGDASCRVEQGDGCARYGRVVGHGQVALLSTAEDGGDWGCPRTAVPTRESFQSLRATSTGSIPVAFHHACSSLA